jgi:DNA polymerase III epsilon subunit-like protein
MLHLNGNKMCAVDIETTGLRPSFHDIIQIAIVPLNNNFGMDQNITPFYTTLKPVRLENISEKAMQINGLKIADLLRDALDPEEAAAIFERWYSEKIEGNGYKKIVPLGYNYAAFDLPFIKEWLGYYSDEPEKSLYDDFFFWQIRDVAMAPLFCNDIAYMKQITYPFPKHGLKNVCFRMGYRIEGHHDALADALAAAELYKRLIDIKLGPAGLDWL